MTGRSRSFSREVLNLGRPSPRESGTGWLAPFRPSPAHAPRSTLADDRRGSRNVAPPIGRRRRQLAVEFCAESSDAANFWANDQNRSVEKFTAVPLISRLQYAALGPITGARNGNVPALSTALT